MAACMPKEKVAAADWTDTKTWVAKHSLAKEVFDEMKASEIKTVCDVKTKFGWTLEKACITAVKRQQHVGIYAGDAETFTDMSAVFDKVINKYHNLKLDEVKSEEESYEKVELPALPKGAIVSTRIRTARNLKSLPFTVNMTKAQRLQLEATMIKVFDTFTGPLVGKYHPMVGMKEADRKSMVDKHWLYINDDDTLDMVGCYTDWPQGRGIYVNDEKHHKDHGIFIVWVGEEDQLRIMAMNKGSDVQAVWDLFYSGVQACHTGVKDQKDDFTFCAKRGYLSSCPTNIGTGMRASVHVDLPKFKTKEICKKWVKSKELMIDIRGTRGEATSTEGCTTYDVSNKARLGSTCVQQITTMVNGVKLLLAVKEEVKE